MSVHLCNYPKPNGIPCGSPALRGKKLCYYHLRDHKRQQYADAAIRRADILGPRLPKMKSLPQVQAALFEVMNAILENRIDDRHAGRVLFALQQAAIPLRQPKGT